MPSGAVNPASVQITAVLPVERLVHARLVRPENDVLVPAPGTDQQADAVAKFDPGITETAGQRLRL